MSLLAAIFLLALKTKQFINVLVHLNLLILKGNLLIYTVYIKLMNFRYEMLVINNRLDLTGFNIISLRIQCAALMDFYSVRKLYIKIYSNKRKNIKHSCKHGNSNSNRRNSRFNTKFTISTN